MQSSHGSVNDYGLSKRKVYRLSMGAEYQLIDSSDRTVMAIIGHSGHENRMSATPIVLSNARDGKYPRMTRKAK